MKTKPSFLPLAISLLVVGVICGCNTRQQQTQTTKVSKSSEPAAKESRYPASWWTPAPKEGAPGWEILPQEAGPGEVILSKRNELGLLSNFADTPFEFRG